jgi:hypothetical protein
MSFLKDFARYVVSRKKYWLLPVFIVMIGVGSLLILGKGSVVAPLIYAIF